MEKSKIIDILLKYKDEHITYIPNPGNAGDSLIVLGTFHMFNKIGLGYEIGDINKKYTGRTLFYAGGGNLVGLYDHCKNFLINNMDNNDIVILPHTIKNEDNLLKSLKNNVKIICREKVSYEYVSSIINKNNVFLCHDMAFYINHEFIDKFLKKGNNVCYCYRTDCEKTSVNIPFNNNDISATLVKPNNTSDINCIEHVSRSVFKHLSQYDEIYTNRLHIAIAGCLLNKKVNLYENAYYKNRAVFDHSITMNYDKVSLIRNNKNAMCFLCVEPINELIEFCSSITTHDIYIILDDNNVIPPNNTNITFIQVDNDKCSKEGYNYSNFFVKKYPSAWDKAFYYFAEKNKNYKHVWLIEDDVLVPKSYTIQNIDKHYPNSDLLTASNEINETGDTSTWFWNRANNGFDLPWYRSMVCACRISNNLFESIKTHKEKHGKLHFIEFMINTLAMHNNLIVDTPNELKHIRQKPLKGDRYRHHFVYKGIHRTEWCHNALLNINNNCLYHPVKDFTLHTKLRNNSKIDIYVINLKNRTDRFEEIKNRFHNFNIIRVDAIKDNNGAIGCFKSHQKCVKIGKDKKLNNIIVIEDDCLPYDNFEFKLNSILNALNTSNKWNMYLGGTFHTYGYNIKQKLKIDNEIFYEINYGYCTQMVIYNNTIYDKFITADPTECPVDHWWPKHTLSLISIPFIATQCNTKSDIHDGDCALMGRRIKRTNNILINEIKNIF